MDLNENNISFLAGYLEGISKVDGQIRERLISAFTTPYDSTISIDDNFFNFFGSDLSATNYKNFFIFQVYK